MSTLKSDNENLKLNADGADKDIIFQSDGSTKVTVKSDGNVGIGNSSPSGILQIEGTTDHLKLTYPSVASYILDVKSGGDFAIDKDGSEKLRIQSGGGISFNGDTAAANALDDYEEGTWTPTMGVSTYAGGTWTSAAGWYTKIGDMVTVWFDITGSGMYFGATIGYMQITNLPFTATQPSGSQTYAGSWSGNDVAQSSGGTVYLNSDIMYLHASNDNSYIVGVSGIGASISYRV
jgi:hypothetical protein